MNEKWKTRLILLTLGALSALGFAPLYYQYLSIICFIALFHYIRTSTSYGQAFTRGYLFGAGHFIVGLYWVANALMVDATMLKMFGWLIPFVYAGSGLVMGLFVAIPARLSFYAKGLLERLLLFITFFTIFEWMREWIFTGLPWNKLGAIWTEILPIVQNISIIGTLGLSFMTLLLCLATYLIMAKQKIKWAVGIIALWIAMIIFGSMRLQPTTYHETTLKIVQTGLSQQAKWHPSELRNNFELHRKLSLYPDATDFVIWAESAIAYDLINNGLARDEAIKVLQKKDAYLITGFIARTDDYVQNMLGIFDQNGLVESYAKSHLVPFGEYVPFKSILPMKKITNGLTNFKPGDGEKTLLKKNRLPFAPAICYEAIFTRSFIDDKNRPAWILILTNDAWYGQSFGPYQHLAEAQLRAIEEGLPVVRSAYSGVSAIIDPYGRIIKNVPLGVMGVINGQLPTALEKTFFTRIYPWAHLLFLGLMLIGIFVWSKRNDNR